MLGGGTLARLADGAAVKGTAAAGQVALHGDDPRSSGAIPTIGPAVRGVGRSVWRDARNVEQSPKPRCAPWADSACGVSMGSS